MSYSEAILAAMATGEEMTCRTVAERSGVPPTIVATYMQRLCKARVVGLISRRRPMLYQMGDAPAEPLVVAARRTQPVSVFDLGRFA